VKPGVPFILVTMLLDWLVVGMLSPVLPNLLVAFKGGHVSNASAILGWFSAAVRSRSSSRRPYSACFPTAMAVGRSSCSRASARRWTASSSPSRPISRGSSSAACSRVAPRRARRRARPGFALGPALGGLLAGIGLRVPFYVAAGMMAANAIYGAFVLPESLPPASRQPRIAWGRANPLGSRAAFCAAISPSRRSASSCSTRSFAFTAARRQTASA